MEEVGREEEREAEKEAARGERGEVGREEERGVEGVEEEGEEEEEERKKKDLLLANDEQTTQGNKIPKSKEALEDPSKTLSTALCIDKRFLLWEGRRWEGGGGYYRGVGRL